MHTWNIEMTPEQFKMALNEVLNENRTVEQEVHTADHKLIAELKPYFIQWMERQKRISKLWQKFQLSFIGSAAVVVVSGLVWVGSLILEAFKHMR